MARFELNTPIATPEPSISVDGGLAIGRHRFRLEVLDQRGNRSTPSDAVVQVQRLIVDPTGPTGPIVLDPAGPVVGPATPVGPRPPIVLEPAGPVIGPVVGPATPVEPRPPIVRPGTSPGRIDPVLSPTPVRPRGRRKKEQP